MLLTAKIAVVYGAAGRVGSAVSRAFVREGASVHLVGRTAETLGRLAEELSGAGGLVTTAVVDASAAAEVEADLDALCTRWGRVDISFNAVSIRGDLQGVPLRELSVENYLLPPMTALRANFITGVAAARRMTAQGSGVILSMSTSAAALSGRDRRYHVSGGFGTACAAVEELSRSLAGEVGPHGVRVVCLRPDGIPETWGDLTVEPVATSVRYMIDGTMLGRLPTLDQVADAAAWAASDRAAAMTGTTMNLTCGSEPG
jgi:3-oxoacyl-[acyl-carrier protein] reductase